MMLSQSKLRSHCLEETIDDAGQHALELALCSMRNPLQAFYYQRDCRRHDYGFRIRNFATGRCLSPAGDHVPGKLYSSSLTTEPCAEGSDWQVFELVDADTHKALPNLNSSITFWNSSCYGPPPAILSGQSTAADTLTAETTPHREHDIIADGFHRQRRLKAKATPRTTFEKASGISAKFRGRKLIGYQPVVYNRSLVSFGIVLKDQESGLSSKASTFGAYNL